MNPTCESVPVKQRLLLKQSLLDAYGGRLPSLIMYDLDGTLVDSVPDLTAAVDQMLMAMGLAAVGVDQVRCWVGNGGPVLVRRALGSALSISPEDVSDEDFNQGLQLFYDSYSLVSGQNSVLFSGVVELLESAHEQGVKQVVITNKPARFVQGLLDDLGLSSYFCDWLGGDSLPEKKPDPAPLVHMLEKFETSTDDALMVGDSVNDIQAAKRAGIRCLAVSYGYNHGRPIESECADWLVDSLADIV